MGSHVHLSASLRVLWSTPYLCHHILKAQISVQRCSQGPVLSVGARALIIELQTSEMVTNRGPEVAFEFECMQNRTPPRETVGPRMGSGPGTRGRLITSSGYHNQGTRSLRSRASRVEGSKRRKSTVRKQQ